MLKLLGKERFESIYPNKSLLDAGVICAYGSDFTVNYPLPLEGISSAMTRKEPKTSDLYETFKNEPAMKPEDICLLKVKETVFKGLSVYKA